MNKHTPGPWRVCRSNELENDWEIYDEDSASTLARPIVDSDGWPVAFVVDSSESYSHRAEFGHDARLIAAAPMLLEALEELFGAGMEWLMMTDGKSDQIAAIAKARAAIAAATGEDA